MTDEHDAFVIGKCAIDSVEILAEQRGRIRIRITARVTEEPKLIMPPDPGIVAERVDHRGPARSSFLQTVNENHRGASWIELLQLSQPRRICVFCGFIRRENPSRSGRSRAINIAVGALRSIANGKLAFADSNALRLQWIDKLKLRSLVRKFNDCRDRCINATKLRLLRENADFLTRPTATNGAPIPLTAERVLKNCSADFQAVGRKQIVSTWIMFLIDGLGSGKKCSLSDRQLLILRVATVEFSPARHFQLLALRKNCKDFARKGCPAAAPEHSTRIGGEEIIT